MNTLIHLPYSPWSERARWALDARQLPHQRKVYLPLVGELALKSQIGWAQKASVPVLLTDSGPLSDGLSIAHFAEERGSGATLFPAGREADVAMWYARGNTGLDAARGLALPRMLRNPEALLEMIPKGLRPAAPFGAVALSRFGVARTIRKYNALAGEAQYMSDLREVLSQLRNTLRATQGQAGEGPATLLGTFSFADIAAAQVLVAVGPHNGPYLRIGHASKRCWTIPEFAEEYGDLLTWRDALYARYRGAPGL